MKPSDIVSKLTKDTSFTAWHKEHPLAFLAHIFLSPQETEEDIQVGYLDPASNQITSFTLADDGFRALPPADYVQTGQAIQQLHVTGTLKDTKIAFALAQETMSKHYPQELPLKKFLILQIIENKPTYNITFFTRTFKTVNCKIDAATGTVRSHSSAALVDFGPGDAAK